MGIEGGGGGEGGERGRGGILANSLLNGKNKNTTLGYIAATFSTP